MKVILSLNKFIKIFSLTLLVSIATNAQKNLPNSSLPWIQFTWHSETLNGRFIDKAAMYVPITINQMPYAFDAQFDLGATSTMIYEKTFAPYLAQAPDLQKKINVKRTIQIEGVNQPCFENITIRLDNIEFTNQNVTLFKNFGDAMTKDSIHSPTTKHIGTVAADLFNKKTLIIDYINQRLCSIDSLPSTWEQKIDFVAIDYIKENNWIFLPLQIGDKMQKVMFDTGSSIFPLLSSPTKIAQITNSKECTDSLKVSSWGDEVTVYSYTPKVDISLGTNKFKSLPIYSNQGLDDESLDGAGFWGIVGNCYFLDKVIVIDYKNKRFGILNTK